MLPSKRLLSVSGLLAVGCLLTMSGCHSARDNGPAPPSAATLAAGKAASIQQVQANPNMSPDQKAAIIARLQGQGTPGVGPSAPPPR